jgi:hypothetical protein
MPGLLHQTVNQGYDFVSPYVEKAQPLVEKARNHVPLVDPALNSAEGLVRGFVEKADELAEPQIQRIKPLVEPRLQQVKERVTPYVDEGVKQYGALREGGLNYYRVGMEKVEQVKGFKDAKETQIREFADPKVAQIKDKITEFADPKVAQIKEFTDPGVEKIKGFTCPRVEKINGFITAKQKKMQKLIRVPASTDLLALKYESLLGKVASFMEKMEAAIDKYMPLTEEQKQDNASDVSVSNVSDSSCVRINRSVTSIIIRPFAVFSVFIMQLTTFPVMGKVTAIKDQIVGKAKPLLAQVNEKLAPAVTSLTQTPFFKKVVQVAVAGSEKMLGKDKTLTLLMKADGYIPTAWKAGATDPSPVATKAGATKED